jgi:carboxyl-terminal processing protease
MPRRLFAYRHLFLAAVTLALQTVTPQFIAGQAPEQITARDREFARDMLSQIHETLKKNYYDPSFHGVNVDERYREYADQINGANTIQAAYRIIEAYLVGLNDSHTIFIPPPNSKRVTYGFRLRMIGDQCFITELRPGSDAAQKLRPGDQVLSLDGYALHRPDLWQLEYYLYRLPPRLTTDFTLRDLSGKVRQESVIAELQSGLALMGPSSPSISRMEVERWQNNIKSRSAEAGDVFIWKLASFNEDEGRLRHMLGEARNHKALILDLRENSGGSESNIALVLSGLFDHDVTIAKQVKRKEQKPFLAKSSGHSAFTGQLIVLIDSRSASASEILARVLQLEHRGIVVGDRSAGSVMAAQFFPSVAGLGGPPFGAEITVADMIMADGKSLEHVGVTPDDIFLPSPADLAAGNDPVLAHAAGLAGAKIDSTAAGKMFPFEWPSTDPIH